MAKFICCYSGLEINVSHFPLYLSRAENTTACHPIFHVEQKKLLSYARKWSSGELTVTDKYLLYVALLKSTDLVYFRVPCAFEEAHITVDGDRFVLKHGTQKTIAQNMEHLLIAVSRINSVLNPRVRFPEVVISTETANLWNSKHWIDNWNQVYEDYKAGITRQEKIAEQSQRELALHRLIKSPHRRIESYSAELATWTAEAADFPIFTIKHPVHNQPVPLAEYYKEIIGHACCKEYFKITNKADLEEVIALCHERIAFSIEKGENSGGSIQSFLLFQVLNDAQKYLDSFITGGEKRTPTIKLPISDTWRFPDATDDSGTSEFVSGIQTLIESVPENAPKPVITDYPNKLAYLTAKFKWDAANTERAKIASGNAEKPGTQLEKSNRVGLSKDSLGF